MPLLQSIYTSINWRAHVLNLVIILWPVLCGCTHVAGNYPAVRITAGRGAAKLNGSGFQLIADSRLKVEKVEAELGNLRSQGFSRHDPQIIRSVARRSDIPPGLLADRSGCSYYRLTARMKPGVGLTLAPGALEITLETENGAKTVCDQGYLVEDRRVTGGCRQPPNTTLALGPSVSRNQPVMNFLVRLPLRGKIVSLSLVPGRFQLTERPPIE